MKDSLITYTQKAYFGLHTFRRRLLPFLQAKHIPFANAVIGKIMRMRMKRITTTQGLELYLDDNDSLALSYNKEYEPDETQFFMENLEEGMRVIDVGANIGYFTTLFSCLVGPAGHVLAFEPDPTNFALLKKNCEANGCNNVRLENCALSDKDGSAKLHLSEVNRGDHRMITSDSERKAIEVPIVRLDDFLKESNKFDFLKMDIQGHEFHAIKGMGKLLDAPNRTFVMEYWPRALREADSDPVELLEFLLSKGFSITDSEDPEAKINSETAQDWTASIPQHTNLILKK
jgi:FkbM family methyltransferase